VRLDGRPIKTPGGRALLAPTAGLAQAMAREWMAQGDKIDPATMPLTQIACTAIDRVAPNQADIAIQVARYAETDLICYRASAPPDLAARQRKSWQPVLDWLSERKGIQLKTTEGILPLAQEQSALDVAKALVDGLDAHRLAAFALLTQSLGSFAIAAAVEASHIAVDQAADLAMLDDIYQNDKWGQDREALARLKGLRDDIDAAARYLELLR